MKKIILFILLMFLLNGASAQFGGETHKTTSGVIVVDRTVEEEGFVFQSRYTKGQNFDATVYESRSLLMELDVISAPANTSLFINQVWAEATIASKLECIDRQTIDTMNDKPEGGGEQLGWWINQNHSYVEEWFIGRFVNNEAQWGQDGYCRVGSDFGALMYLGTILQIDYDFYVKKDNEPHAYKFSFVDNIMFSSDGELVDVEDVAGGNENASFPFIISLVAIPFIIYMRKKLRQK